MRNFFVISFLFLGLTGCFDTETPLAISRNQIVEYQKGEDEFVVIIVQTDGLSRLDAKKFARRQAAEVALENGFSYITIESEGEVTVVQSDRKWPSNEGFYGNMYEEMILQKDFDRDSMRRESPPDSSFQRGWKIVFKAYEKEPKEGGIDVCTLTPCH